MNEATRPRIFPAWSWRVWVGFATALGLLAALTLFSWSTGPSDAGGFEEFKMPERTDMPVAIATARDGTVWFTLESSDALGRVRHRQIEKIPKGAESIEPLGLAVDGDDNVWYTEATRQRISRVSPDGTIASFGLSTPVAGLGRLAVGPDGAVWFAETTVASVTLLKEERFTRHVVATLSARISRDAVPFGVAVAPDGAVWATLPAANQVLRIARNGEATVFDVPTRRSGLTDIAVGVDGTVYFLELAANKIGRVVSGRLDEFAVPTPAAGLTGLAVAPDGAVWFTELRGHQLGRLRDGAITEFRLPRPDARPLGIAVDARNNVWYADLSGWLGRLDASRARVR